MLFANGLVEVGDFANIAFLEGDFVLGKFEETNQDFEPRLYVLDASIRSQVALEFREFVSAYDSGQFLCC